MGAGGSAKPSAQVAPRAAKSGSFSTPKDFELDKHRTSKGCTMHELAVGKSLCVKCKGTTTLLQSKTFGVMYKCDSCGKVSSHVTKGGKMDHIWMGDTFGKVPSGRKPSKEAADQDEIPLSGRKSSKERPGSAERPLSGRKSSKGSATSAEGGRPSIVRACTSGDLGPVKGESRPSKELLGERRPSSSQEHNSERRPSNGSTGERLPSKESLRQRRPSKESLSALANVGLDGHNDAFLTKRVSRRNLNQEGAGGGRRPSRDVHATSDESENLDPLGGLKVNDHVIFEEYWHSDVAKQFGVGIVTGPCPSGGPGVVNVEFENFAGQVFHFKADKLHKLELNELDDYKKPAPVVRKKSKMDTLMSIDQYLG